MARRPTPAASLKIRAVPYTNGSQTNSPIPLTSWKPYNSFDSAVRNGSRVYTKNGTTYIISQTKVSNGVWKFTQKTEAQHGKQIIQNTNSGRRQRSSASYNPPPITERKPLITNREAIKVSRINRKGQQFHHIMDLDGYKHIYAGLDPRGRQQLNALLNKNGFYPGDDRRNYIGLVGSNVRKGSEHQGLVHPRTYAFRKTNPIPTAAQLAGLNPQQRLKVLLPHLQQERSILQQVVKEERRPNSNARPKPQRSASATPNSHSSATKAALAQTRPPASPAVNSAQRTPQPIPAKPALRGRGRGSGLQPIDTGINSLRRTTTPGGLRDLLRRQVELQGTGEIVRPI
ncbi:MAG: hypothetical protein RIQ88_447 [Actinomycetota bacterium]|jgi:hypothetical protein